MDLDDASQILSTTQGVVAVVYVCIKRYILWKLYNTCISQLQPEFK